MSEEANHSRASDNTCMEPPLTLSSNSSSSSAVSSEKDFSHCSRTDSNVSNAPTKKKSKRTSKTATLQAEVDNRFKVMEDNINAQFDRFFQMMQSKNTPTDKTATYQYTGSSALPRSDSNVVDGPSGEPRPLLRLDPHLDEDLGTPKISSNRDFDVRSEMSFAVNDNESREFDIRSEYDETNDSVGNSPMHVHTNPVENYEIQTESNKNRSERFLKHVNQNVDNEHLSEQETSKETSERSHTRRNDLSQLFRDDIAKEKSNAGLILDQAQVNILENSWRSKNPERITSFKEEYKNVFPIHDSAVDFLKVPTLDDILEPMLRKTHGQKAVRTWSTHRQLHTQPCRQIEKLGYSAQLAARMNIISTLYIQQTLGALLKSLSEDEIDRVSVCQTVKDVFAMTTKSLDQAGRTGAMCHLIRRKAATQDCGLANINDINIKSQYLPLTDDGLFGSGLEKCLEKRKEQKDQLTDLLPEFTQTRKRKFDSSSDNRSSVSNPKQTKTNENKPKNVGNSSGFGQRNSQEKSGNFSKSDKTFPAKKDGKSGSRGSWGFRIPKKNDS